MQTVCGTQVSSGRAILEISQDEGGGGGGGEVSWNHTVVMDNGWGGPVVANKVLRESYGKLGGGSQEYYKPIVGNQVNFISTQPKSFTPLPPRQAISNKK